MAQENFSVSGSFEYIPGETLTSTLWNQDGTIYIPIDGEQVALTGFDYNKFCPVTKKDSKIQSVTGCTNTADSQVLYYWMQRGYKFNLSVDGGDYFTLAAEEVKEGQEKTKYYVSDTPTLGEGSMSAINSYLASANLSSGDFIAALNYYCGVKNNSEYGESTGTSWWFGTFTDGTNALAFKAAGFDSYYSITALYLLKDNPYFPEIPEESKIFFDENGLTETGWSIIRENLDYGEVIRVSIPGHAIYLDGYRFNEETQKYEYHLNYGWGTDAEAYTKWYSVDELANAEEGYYQPNQIDGITIDLSPDIKVVVSNARGDYYGGSFIRGLERINHIQNDKETTFTFSDDIAGKSIVLSENAALTSKVDVEFRNFNVNLYTTAGTLFTSDDAMSFELFDGSIVVNSSSATSAIDLQGKEKLAVELNSGWIFSGYLRNGQEILLNNLDKDNGYVCSSVSANILNAVSGYAIRSGSGNDEITLTNNSAVFGMIDLGGGKNVITIENGSLLYGGFAGGDRNTLTVNMVINSALNGPMIVADDSTSFANLYKLTGGVVNLEICAGVAAQDYTLITGYSATDMMSMTVNLTVDGKEFVLDYDNRTAGDYTLSFDGANLVLHSNKSIAAVEPVRIFNGATVVSAGKSMEKKTLASNNNMYVSRNGLVNSTTVKNGGFMEVLSGGMAKNTEVVSGGAIHIHGGADIRGVEVSAGAVINGFTNKDSAFNFDENVILGDVTTTSRGGYLYAGQSAETIDNGKNTVNIYGSVHNIANSSGTVNIYAGGRVNSIDTVKGSVKISSGGYLGGMIAESGTVLRVGSGASAANIIIDGTYYLESGAVITGTQHIGGKMYVNGAVNARGAYVTFDMTDVELADGAMVDNLANLNAFMYSVTIDEDMECGTYILAGNAASTFVTNVALNDAEDGSIGYLQLGGYFVSYEGKTYLLERIDGSLCLTVGLTAAPSLEGSMVTLFSSGTAVKSAAVLTGEKVEGLFGNNLMHVSSGGFANMTALAYGGRLEVYSGGSALVTSVGGGLATVYSGGVMNNTDVNASMCVIGGVANKIELAPGAFLAVHDGGVASGVSAEGRNTEVHIYGHGVVSNLKLFSSAQAAVENGEVIGANISSAGRMYIEDGAYVENLAVKADGSAYISGSAEVTGLKIADGGYMQIDVGSKTKVSGENGFGRINIRNGVASGFKFSSGVVNISKGCSALKLGVDKSAELHLLAGASADALHIGNGGYVVAHKGGEVSDTTVWSSGKLEIFSGAVHTGKLHIYEGGKVMIYRDGELNFSIAGNTVSDTYMVNDLSAVSGTPTYTITVLATQGAGTYKLAQGAENLNRSTVISIGDGNISYGKMTLAGKKAARNGVTYTLVRDGGDLLLTISGDTKVVNNDLDGNGLSDVLLRHDAGFVGSWQSTGDADVIAWGNLTNIRKDVVILGNGSVDGETILGQDLFYQDGKTVGAWLMENGKVVGFQKIWDVDSDTINVIGLGDFNGDGKTDLLLRSDYGTIGCYMTDGTGWNGFQSVGKEWEVVAVGDLNDDGKDDLVVKHTQGYAGAWITQDDGSVKWSDLDTLKDGTEIIGAGDFNGDGTDDVLLRKGSWVGAWLVEDGEVSDYMGIFNNRSDVEQIGDFDGDGIDDLRIRNAAGDIGVLYVKGADTTEWQYFKSVGDEWTTKFSALA